MENLNLFEVSVITTLVFLRKAQGKTQKDVVKWLNLTSQAQVSRLETGFAKLRVQTLKDYCEGLGVPISEVLTAAEKQDKRAAELGNQLYPNSPFEEMSKEQKTALLQLAASDLLGK